LVGETEQHDTAVLDLAGGEFEEVARRNEQRQRAGHGMSDVRECQALDAQFVVRQRRVVVLADRLDLAHAGWHRTVPSPGTRRAPSQLATGASQDLSFEESLLHSCSIGARYHAMRSCHGLLQRSVTCQFHAA
jgi:hypothetical protein